MVVTLTTLRARARERADATGAAYVSDTATSLDAFINAGADELWNLLLERKDDFTVKDYAFTTSGDEVSVPSDFVALRGIDIQVDGKWLPMDRFEWGERNRWRNLTTSTGAGTRYCLRSDKVKIYPQPPSGLSASMSYLCSRPALVNGADTLSVRAGWEEYVVLYAAIAILSKQEDDPTELKAKLLELKADIRGASSRDQAGPAQVRDVERVDYEADDYLLRRYT